MQVTSDLQRVDKALKTKIKKLSDITHCEISSFRSARLNKRYLSDKIKDDEVGGACGTNGGESLVCSSPLCFSNALGNFIGCSQYTANLFIYVYIY